VELEQNRTLGTAELGRLAFESAFGARDRHSFTGAHPQQIDLKLRERREYVEKALAHRVGGVIDRAP
jgi:hypothetical protein